MCVGELLHLGSLLHDDVVDDGDVRRDRPAAHRVYGNAVTVLTGDFCLARAVLLASEEGGASAVHALGEVVTEMAEGEVLQLQRAGDLGCTVEQYLDVVARKSAALIAWCVPAPARSPPARSRPPWPSSLRPRGGHRVPDHRRRARLRRGHRQDPRRRSPGAEGHPAADPRDGGRPRAAGGARRRPAVQGAGRDWLARIRATDALDRALDEARARAADAVESLSSLPPSEARDALGVLARYLVERVR